MDLVLAYWLGPSLQDLVYCAPHVDEELFRTSRAQPGTTIVAAKLRLLIHGRASPCPRNMVMSLARALTQLTRDTWQPYYGHVLSNDEITEIPDNMVAFLRCLGESWPPQTAGGTPFPPVPGAPTASVPDKEPGDPDSRGRAVADACPSTAQPDSGRPGNHTPPPRP
jgi:hypothetical protein